MFTPLIGRFGNQLFQWAHARKRAELEGKTLCTPPWVGEQIFDIHPACREQGEHIGGYRQKGEDLIYSRREVLQWLRLKPEIQAKLDSFVPQGEIVAHLRRGDYVGYGNYPLVSRKSYLDAAEQFGFDSQALAFITEEEPLTHPDFTGELALLPDFYRMMRARVLFRGNSSFSWWAGTLGEARVFSPCIKSKPNGVESDCEFSEGNHERLSNDETVCSDLHLFHESQRYTYDIGPLDEVIDIGGYNGDFAAEIHRKYGCHITVYEPVFQFFQKIRERFKRNGRIVVRRYAIGRETGRINMRIKGDMTGAFAEGPAERCLLRDAADLMPAKLLKINCEGLEYDILERLLESGRAKEYANIQVQFHKVVPEYASRYAAIRDGLLKTHRLTFDEPFCWQNFELR